MSKRLQGCIAVAVLFCFCLSLPAALQAQKKAYETTCVGFYNLENLFDTIDQVNVLDEEFTPQGAKKWRTVYYQDKLGRLSDVLSQVGTEQSPDGLAIFGAAEIENRAVLEDLVKQEKLKSRQYEIVHFDSPDARGIDVALMYQPKYFRVISARPVPMISYISEGSDHKTRDILYVSGLLRGEPVHIMVNHWPSRRGGEESTRRLRNAAANICKTISDSIRTITPDAKIIIMGDLNDDPINESLVKVLKAEGKREQCMGLKFYNPFLKFYKEGIGTTAYQDAWSLFDQIIVSCGLADEAASGWRFYKAFVFNRPWMLQKSGRYEGYPLRTFDGDTYMSGYSDHFPTYLMLIREKK